jgi:hypothetical protein
VAGRHGDVQAVAPVVRHVWSAADLRELHTVKRLPTVTSADVMTEAAGTTYLAANGWEQLDQAQAELEKHLNVTVAGRCRTCGEPEPCGSRRAASAVFARYGCLPERTPGATVPDFLRRVA